MSDSPAEVRGAVRRTRPASEEAAEFQYICELSELTLDEFRTVDLAGRDICIVRTVAGVFAIGTSCPHQGANMCDGAIKGTMQPSDRNEYDFVSEGEIVTCPWHGYEFDMRSGASVGGAIKARLGAYQVEVRGESVYCSTRRQRPPRPERPERPARPARASAGETS